MDAVFLLCRLQLQRLCDLRVCIDSELRKNAGALFAAAGPIIQLLLTTLIQIAGIMAGGDVQGARRSAAEDQQASADAQNAMHRILSLAQQIAINDPAAIRSIGSVIQARAALATWCPFVFSAR